MSQYELNLRDYLRIFRKRKVLIVSVFLTLTVGSALYACFQKSLYQSAVTVKIEERNTIAGLITEWVIHNPGNLMESQTKIIKGYPILKKAGEKLGLLNENSTPDAINTVVNQIQARIEAERVGQTNMIKINVVESTPKGAVDLAHAVVGAYMEENLLEKAKQFSQARQFIEEQLVSLENRLRGSEENLHKASEDVNNLKLADSIQQKQVVLELELSDLLQRYTEKYPRVIQIHKQIEEIGLQLKHFSARELQLTRLMREIEVNKKLYTMLEEKLEEMRISEAQKVGDISIVNPANIPHSPVSGNRNGIVLIGMLMGLLLGFTSAFIIETLDTSISTIEDVENMVKLPILGIVPSVEDGNRERTGILSALKEILFPIPKSEEEERRISLIAHYKPRSPIAEAYRNIQTNLKLNSHKKTILVTSSGPREGKSTVVSNLGIVMSQAGLKTLLVSFDLRRPVLAKNFGISKSPGLSELIIGTVNLDTVFKNITDIFMGDLNFEDIRKTPGIENIWILPSGNLPRNPVEMLKASETFRLVEKLKNQFDVILFDSPPVLLVTDASILAPHMDCTIIVYEIGRTSREALVRTKVQLESVGAKIGGVILNHTQSHMESIASYPYYTYKYKTYGKDTGDTKTAVVGNRLIDTFVKETWQRFFQSKSKK